MAPANINRHYVHLCTGSSLQDIKDQMAKRAGVAPGQVAVVLLESVKVEGANDVGCPISTEVIEPADVDLLVLAKWSEGLFTVMAVVVYDFLDQDKATNLYNNLRSFIPSYGIPTQRRTGQTLKPSKKHLCHCQGVDPEHRGESYSFGCAQDMCGAGMGCKFHASHTEREGEQPARFKVTDPTRAGQIEGIANSLAQMVGERVQELLPEAYRNMIRFVEAKHCGIGMADPKPFTGFSVVVDYSAHRHTDDKNAEDGVTGVLTLLHASFRGALLKKEGMQVHTLPFYKRSGSQVQTGGVALLLPHGSLLLEFAKGEHHATTSLPLPNRHEPTRMGLVFYRHGGLEMSNHGSPHPRLFNLPVALVPNQHNQHLVPLVALPGPEPDSPEDLVNADAGSRRGTYLCTRCGSVESSRWKLDRHMVRHHSLEKRHLCQECGKMFPTAHDLVVHGSVHTDDKPYSCPRCPKSYKTKAALGHHFSNRHP